MIEKGQKSPLIQVLHVQGMTHWGIPYPIWRKYFCFAFSWWQNKQYLNFESFKHTLNLNMGKKPRKVHMKIDVCLASSLNSDSIQIPNLYVIDLSAELSCYINIAISVLQVYGMLASASIMN